MVHSDCWSYRLYRAMRAGLDWIFPPVCAGCGTLGARWRDDCRRRAAQSPEPLCERCGLPLERARECATCVEHPPAYRLVSSCLTLEGPIRKAMHRLKNRRDLGLGDALAEGLRERVLALDWQVDLVVPILQGRQRIRERGYNQIGLMARPWALSLGWRCAPKALRRARETRSQVGLRAEGRRKNVRDSFLADIRLVRGRKVLLMNDVATTGSTLTAAAQAL